MRIYSRLSLLAITILLSASSISFAFLDGVDIGGGSEDREADIRLEAAITDIPALITRARSGDLLGSMDQALTQLSSVSAEQNRDKATLSFVVGSIHLALYAKTKEKEHIDQAIDYFINVNQYASATLPNTNFTSNSSSGSNPPSGSSVPAANPVLPSSSGSEVSGPDAVTALIQEIAVMESENLTGAPNSGSTSPEGSAGATNGVLNVPPISQYISENIVVHNGRRTDYRGSWCGPTSVRMCAEYYGITGHSTYEFAQWCQYTFQRRIGTPLTGMASCVENRLNLSGSELKTPGTMDWLRESLREGKPVIAHCNRRWNGHYIVVTGINGNTVHVNDPGTRQSNVVRTFSLSEFTSYWSSKSYRGLKVAR